MRDEVELVYGSVRFPDEIVDSFDIKNDEKKNFYQIGEINIDQL